ncbi:MAG TPA: MarR family winged helix-turn-helix transcriptional regulator [Allosphingosinicella sp.]
MVDYARAARLLLLADSPQTRNSVEAAAELASCRVVPLPLSGWTDGSDELPGFDAVFLSIDAADEGGAELLLDRIVRQTGARTRCVIEAPLELIDLAASRAWGPAVLHVSNPSDGERAEAVAWAIKREPERLHDSGRGASRLQQLSEEASRIASALASLSESEAQREIGQERPIDAARVRAIIRARRLRDQFLGADLFADPAWDMLLDLMAARLEGQRVPVSSLCMAAAVPPTTALRWIKVLSEQGIFVRTADPQDGRRIYIELADEIAAALDAYLRAAQRISPIIF